MQSLVQSMVAMYVNGSVLTFVSVNSNIHPASHASSVSSGFSSLSQLPSNFGFGFAAPESFNSGSSSNGSQPFQPFSAHNANGNQFGNQGHRSFGNYGYQSFGNSSSNNFGGNSCRGKGHGGYRPKFNGNRFGSWSGNTLSRHHVIPKCQICFRTGHTIVTCLFRSDNTQAVQERQICGKQGHIAIDCRHRGNYVYQGAPPLSSLSANYAYQEYSS